MKKLLTILCILVSVGGAALFCIRFAARRLRHGGNDELPLPDPDSRMPAHTCERQDGRR